MDIIGRAQELANQIKQQEGTEVLRAITDSIVVTGEGLSITYNEGTLLEQVGFKGADQSLQKAGIKVNLKRKGFEDKLVLFSDYSKKDIPLIKMLVQAHGWLELVRDGEARTVGDIAEMVGLQERYVGKHIKLALLAPDIQKAILNGTQPASLTLEILKAGGHEKDWGAQRLRLGF